MTLFSQIFASTGLILVDSEAKLALFVAFHIGIFITYFINPDTDIHQRAGRIGNILGLEDYEREIPHRYGMRRKNWKKPLKAMLGSHIPGTGTLVRIAPILFLGFVVHMMVGMSTFYHLLPSMTAFFLLGATWSDCWHVLLDYL